MNIKITSSNAEIKHKLEFLFEVQLENEMKYIFEKKGVYVIEYDVDGGVLGLVLNVSNFTIETWETIDTETLPPVQCLNRIAMVHLMSFFQSPADFSNFSIIVDEDIRCVCSAEKVKTTHANWCDKFEKDV